MPVKLLLREDTKDLGISGDIITVADGYARNYLLPRRIAVEVTPDNLRAIEVEKKRRAARELEHIKDLRALAARIEACDITLRERVSSGDQLYGAVPVKDIVAVLAEEEINIDQEMVEIPEPVKSLGVHRIKVKLCPEVEAELKVWVVQLKETEGSTAS